VLIGTRVTAQSPTVQGKDVVGWIEAARKDGADWLRQGTVWVAQREATARFATILLGPKVAGGKSWARPGQSRYSWTWLAGRYDTDADGAISRAEFSGVPTWFDLLDRDRDGRITSVDLDWSDDAPLTKASQQARSVFGAIDADGNGHVTPEEWQEFYQQVAKDKGYVAQDDLIPLLLASKSRSFGGSLKATEEMKWKQITAFMRGDVGSWLEGPRPGAAAPNFTLATLDGARTITLSDSFGKKPVVLIFGSFT
jgi:hypothetical protein